MKKLGIGWAVGNVAGLATGLGLALEGRLPDAASATLVGIGGLTNLTFIVCVFAYARGRDTGRHDQRVQPRDDAQGEHRQQQ
jgi:hypothetical protein